MKIEKKNGRCYNVSSNISCAFWKFGKGKNDISECTLFKVTKPGTKALRICNIVYGKTYSGRI